MRKRNNKGRFIQGVSGNPGGRPKVIENIRDLARQYTKEAVCTLVAIAQNTKAKDSDRIQAVNSLLDRAYGKPAQYRENLNVGSTLEDYLMSLPDPSDDDVVDL